MVARFHMKRNRYRQVDRIQRDIRNYELHQ